MVVSKLVFLTYFVKTCIIVSTFIRIIIHFAIDSFFTEDQWQEKQQKHPELREKTFIERVKQTIEAPSFVYEDFLKSERFVYYCREFKINSRTVYTKIVLVEQTEDLFVITAYRPDYVKERSKTKLLYGKDED